jgi:hypothetical protein
MPSKSVVVVLIVLLLAASAEANVFKGLLQRKTEEEKAAEKQKAEQKKAAKEQREIRAKADISDFVAAQKLLNVGRFAGCVEIDTAYYKLKSMHSHMAEEPSVQVCIAQLLSACLLLKAVAI